MYLFDPLIRKLVKQGADMAVNLAAGLDTGPYRMRLPASLNWIEVDSPEILDYKEELLKRAMPAGSLERGRLDFSHAEIRCSLFGGLAGRAANALVITEGLLIYGGDGDLVPDLGKGSRQNPGTLLPNLGIRIGGLAPQIAPLMRDPPGPRG